MAKTIEKTTDDLSNQLPIRRIRGWKEFQNFGTDLINRLDDEFISCKSFGDDGDKQYGVDAEAVGVDGTVYGVQYKFKQDFTKSDAIKMVEAATYPNANKYLALVSCRVSTGVENYLKESGWELWTEANIVEKMRSLSIEKARWLVRRYLGSEYVASFLGVSPKSIFETKEEFFDQAYVNYRIFSHDYPLIARKTELTLLHEFVSDESRYIQLLVGSGGTGKSKLLYEFVKSFENAEWKVRFVNVNYNLNPEIIGTDDLSLDPTIIIVDDAHRYLFLPQLLSMLKKHAAPIKLVLSLRPSGDDFIRGQLWDVLNNDPKDIAIHPFTNEDRKLFAEALLGKGYDRWLPFIEEAAKESPFIAVLSAHLISQGVLLNVALNYDEFRKEIYNRFKNEILGEAFGAKSRVDFLKLMRLISILSPVPKDSTEVHSEMAKVLNVSASELRNGINVLVKSGVVVYQQYTYKIIPDLLSDYILDDACVSDGKESGFVEEVYERFSEYSKIQILSNVAELDWRMNTADNKSVSLLDLVWKAISADLLCNDGLIQSKIVHGLSDVAYSQAPRVLELVYEFIEATKASTTTFQYGVREELTKVIKECSYYSEVTLSQSLSLLWSQAKEDIASGYDSKSNHALSRIMEMASYSPQKALQYNKVFLRYFDSLITQHMLSTIEAAAVLKICDKLLVKSNFDVYHRDNKFYWVPFKMSVDKVNDIRTDTLRIIREIGNTNSLQLIVEIIKTLREALKDPSPAFSMTIEDTDRIQWSEEQLIIFQYLNDIQTRFKSPVVDYLIIEAASWHRKHSASSEVRDKAALLIDGIEVTPSLQILRMLVLKEQRGAYLKPEGFLEEDRTKVEIQSGQYIEFFNNTADLFVQLYPDIDKAASALLRVIQHAGYVVDRPRPSYLMCYIGERAVDYSYNLCSHIIDKYADTLLLDHVGSLLFKLRQKDSAKAELITRRLMAIGEMSLLYEIVESFEGFNWDTASSYDLGVLDRLLEVKDEHLVHLLIQILSSSDRVCPDFILKKLLALDLGDADNLAEEYCQALRWREPSKSKFTTDVVERVLQKLEPIRTIDRHSIMDLVNHFAESNPSNVVDYFIGRVIDRITNQTSYFSAIPHNHPVIFSLVDKPEVQTELLRKVLAFGQEYKKYDDVAQLWIAISCQFSSVSISDLESWVDYSSGDKVDQVICILGYAPKKLYFENPHLLHNILEATARLHPLEFKRKTAYLLHDSFFGVRIRPHGVPSDEDIDIRQRADQAREQHPLGSIIYQFYSDLERAATERIERDLD